MYRINTNGFHIKVTRQIGNRSTLEQGNVSNGTYIYDTVYHIEVGENGRPFSDDIFKCIFLNEDTWISITFLLKFVPKGTVDNILALVQLMAWRRPGDKPLSERMMVVLAMHICVTRPQWDIHCSPIHGVESTPVREYSFMVYWWNHPIHCFTSKLTEIYVKVNIRTLTMFRRLLATLFMVGHHFCPVLVSLLSRESVCWSHSAVSGWLLYANYYLLIIPTTIQPVIIENNVQFSGLGLSQREMSRTTVDVEKYGAI